MREKHFAEMGLFI